VRTELQQVTQRSMAPEAGRAPSRPGQSQPEEFARTLAQIKTVPSGQKLDVRQVGISDGLWASGSTQAASTINTPFGKFDMNSRLRQVVDVKAASETEAFFMTHAPGEWWHNPAMREVFAKTYGNQALAILDATGTVPANMDPTWVTRGTNNTRPT
jgi:hypothetical protein